MLKSLQKYFKPAQAQTEEVEMTEIEKATLAAAESKAAELAVALESANTTQAEQAAVLAELTTKYEAAQAALSASAEAQATLVAQAKAKVTAERTASLTKIMGDVAGPKMAASLESLDDATFATVLSGYATSFENEAASAMFKEAGVANDKPAVEVDAVQKMAEKFAAEFKISE